MDTYAVELNSFVDTVLTKVYDLGKKRNVIFSSFNPDICLLLSFKQPSIPILFLTDAGTNPVGDIRASSLQEAIRFASRWNLLGIVSAAEPLVISPRLVRVVKESGLVCVSYGTMNNDPDKVKVWSSPSSFRRRSKADGLGSCKSKKASTPSSSTTSSPFGRVLPARTTIRLRRLRLRRMAPGSRVMDFLARRSCPVWSMRLHDVIPTLLFRLRPSVQQGRMTARKVLVWLGPWLSSRRVEKELYSRVGSGVPTLDSERIRSKRGEDSSSRNIGRRLPCSPQYRGSKT